MTVTCQCFQCAEARRNYAPVVPAEKENTMDVTKAVPAIVDAIRLAYKGDNDLSELTPSDYELIDKVIEEGMVALRKSWCALERVVPHADELDADDYSVSRAVTTHVVDWYFEHHMTKTYEAEFTVTYTRKVTVSFKCRPGEADSIADTIRDQLAEHSADESIDEDDFTIDDGEVTSVSDDGSEHYDTDLEGVSEQ